MSKMFRDKKEYYSLRKFKGIGLASALVGLAFLSPSVLAEETATPSAPAGEVGVVAPTTEPNKVETTNTSSTSESSKVENNSVAPEVANVGNTSLVTGGSAKPEEVAKPAEVVTPEVSVSPVTPSSPKAEESSQDAKPALNEGTTKPNKQDSVESSQPARSRRGKRDVSSSEESTTGNIKLFGLDGDNATLVPATGREVVTAIDYTDGSNPQKAPVGDNYNNQISKVEILSTSTSRVRVRVSLVDGETIPEGGKIQLASLGASSFDSNKLLMNSTVVGSGLISASSPNNKLSPRKDLESSLKSAATVEEYLSILKGLKRFDYPVSMINLTMNSSFSSYNKNRVLEFELTTTSSTIYDSLALKSEDLSKDGIYNSVGSLERPSKETLGYIINPYDNSKIMNLRPFSGGASVHTPYKDSRPVNDNLKMLDSSSFSVSSLPYFLTSANLYPLNGLGIDGGVPSSTRNRLSAGDYIKTSLTNDSIFKSDISHKVGDVVEVSVRNSSPSKISVESSQRFSDTDKYVVEKITTTGYSYEDTKVRLRLVELTDTTIKWELLDDVKLTKDQLYMGLNREFFNYSLREDWISRFGKDSLLNYLKSGGDPSKYTDNSKFKLTSEFSENGTPHSKDSYGSISRNPNIVWGDKSTGSVKVKYVLDTGELLKEVNLVENQPWDTRTVVDLPEKFGEAMLYSTSETGLPNTLVGIGDRTITVTYKNPISEEISETPPTKKYVLDNSKEGTYKNEVVGTPNKVVRTVTYKFNKDSGWSEDIEDYIDVPGTPTVVTLGTKPTTEVTYQDFTTRYVADPTRTAGEKFTETAGVRGTTTTETTYSVNKETGIVTPTKGQPVVVAPKDAVVKVGTKPTVTETSIPVTTKYKADNSIDFGKEEVESQGQVGTRTTTTPKVLNTTNGMVSDGQPTTKETPMTPKVVKKGTKPKVVETPVNFDTVYEADETKGKGVRTDKVVGVQGKVITTTTYTLNETTGVVTANNPTERRENPTNKVVTIGTAPTVATKRIAHGVEYQRDDTVSASAAPTRVQNGVDGEKRTTTTYNVNPTTGLITENKPVETTVASKPQIEKLGTKPEDIVTTQDFKRTFVADENKDLGYRQIETQGVRGKTVVHRTYTLPENVPPVEDNGQAINYEFAVAIPHDSEPVVTVPVNEVTRVGVKPKVETQTIAVTTKYIADENLEFGKVVETEKGSEGRVVTTTTYTMNPTDGTTTANKPTVDTTPMVQRVVKVGVKKKVVETPIEFTTRYERDETADAGKKTPSVSGVAGKTITTTTYTMNPTTGVVTENPSTTVREEPTTAVIKVGAKSKVVVTPIPVEVEEVADPELFEGDEKVTSNGKAGSTTTTTEYVVNPKTGEITEKDPVVSIIPMEKKIVHKGTKKRKATVTISYVLKDNGSSLGSPTVLENQQVGSPYNTSVKVFEPKVEVSELPDRTITKTTTYVLEKEPENKSGIVTEKGVSVVYTYRAMVREEVVMKESKLTVNFVLEGSGEKLHESLVKEGVRVGDPYVTEPLALKDKVEKRVERNKEVITTTRYELVETPSNAKGAISVGGTAVDYFYRAVVKVDEYPTIPNDAPKTDLPEYTNPIGTPGIPEVHDKPTYLGHVGTPGDSEVHELPEFNGGVVPNDAPKVEIPAYDNGVVPNYAPIHEVPEYTEPLGFVPSDAPQFELPEFKGGVVPNDAPILEKPEYKIPTVSEEPKQPAVPVVEIPQSQPQPQAPQQQFVAKELPNTGTSDSDKLVALSGVGLLGLLGFSFKKRKED